MMLFVAIHAQYTIPVLSAIFIDYVQCDAFQVKLCFVMHEKVYAGEYRTWQGYHQYSPAS